ncbi:unnamed protein product [Oppiella nova]|uniref:Uncharacterized protein n=1 Tax=Oppiella nova TaxID=334625 RepID=A0A7R9LW41_9ACAR|nr:unnamed protein product [Oppiella nova]CAG2167438.1 unnamed protein product [Oppiella nova]
MNKDNDNAMSTLEDIADVIDVTDSDDGVEDVPQKETDNQMKAKTFDEYKKSLDGLRGVAQSGGRFGYPVPMGTNCVDKRPDKSIDEYVKALYGGVTTDGNKYRSNDSKSVDKKSEMTTSIEVIGEIPVRPKLVDSSADKTVSYNTKGLLDEFGPLKSTSGRSPELPHIDRYRVSCQGPFDQDYMSNDMRDNYLRNSYPVGPTIHPKMQ